MKRKREIVALAKEYYKEYEILRDLSPEVFERAILDMFYTKIKVPYELQDRKRDSGAFRHLLEKYNFKYFTSLDFVITMIKLAEEYGVCSTSVFEIEKYADKALEMLTESVENNKLSIIWRDK